MRLPKDPTPIKRIGHGVMGSPQLKETVQWFRDTLGFICSDDVYVESQDNLIGSFNRCDRDDEYVDHHVFFCLKHQQAGLNHFSFEVHDIDDVIAGHQRLAGTRQVRAHVGDRPAPARQPGLRLLGGSLGSGARALGRHRPPERQERLESATGARGARLQWGGPPPEKFIKRICP